MQVRIINDNEGRNLPKGSVIHVSKELKNNYIGIHTSADGSYLVKIRKENVEKIYE